jgi:hypothetical protein
MLAAFSPAPTPQENSPMRSLTLCLALFAITARAPGAALHAQWSMPAAVGQRIRVTTQTQHGRRRYVGRVIAVKGDSLALQANVPDSIRAVAISQMTKLEVSGGRHTNGWRGMGYGLVIGAGAGAIYGAATWREGRGSSSFFGQSADYRPAEGVSPGGGAILGGVLGLTVGGIYGRLHQTERWVRRPLGTGARVGVMPAAHGRIALSVRMQF